MTMGLPTDQDGNDLRWPPKQSGPCVICGGTNYNLSCGGPTICPKCDCGQFDAATVEKQAKVIADLRKQLVCARKALEPFALNPGAVSLSKALGHITREHLLAAKAALTDDPGTK